MDIELKLTHHCIQTAAKMTYERLLNRYFDADVAEKDRAQIENEIEVLKHFLEHADFATLRSRYTELSGGKDHSVILQAAGALDQMKIISTGKEIEPVWRT